MQLDELCPCQVHTAPYMSYLNSHGIVLFTIMASSVFSFNFIHGATLIHVKRFFKCRMLAET